MIFASTAWGLSAIYYKLLDHVPPMEVMAHRVLWSFVIFFLILVVRKRVGGFVGLLRPSRTLFMVILASLMVSANWFLFIWAVHYDRILETSLGYFTQPLVAVIFGVWIFAERPKRAQWVAIAMAALAVILLTFWLGKLPWVSLTLAITFALYGVIKKTTVAGSTVSVTAEALVLLPFAVAWLILAHNDGSALGIGAFGANLSDSLLLIFSGVLTAGPLMLMSYAAQRIPMTAVGVLQYLNPSLQFICAVVIFSEPFGIAHTVAFGLIWTALAIYTWSEFRRG